MREICKSGSEGGGGESRSLPLSAEHEHLFLIRGAHDHEMSATSANSHSPLVARSLEDMLYWPKVGRKQ